MDDTTSRNKHSARQIESWLLNQMAIRGTAKIARAMGLDKSSLCRWKENMLPKVSMLLAELEWGVVDDDVARVSKQVALYLEENILAGMTNKKRPVGKTERSNQITLDF